MSVNFTDTVRFCPYCGRPVERREVSSRERPHCPRCEVTFFADPKLAVAVLIEDGGRVVLQRRTIDPGMGLWTFPSGFVDRGEVLERAAEREAREETGLEVEITGLLGVYSYDGEPVVLVVYTGQAIGGSMAGGDESDAVAAFEPGRLPPLAFHHDGRIIDTWRRVRAASPDSDVAPRRVSYASD